MTRVPFNVYSQSNDFSSLCNLLHGKNGINIFSSTTQNSINVSFICHWQQQALCAKQLPTQQIQQGGSRETRCHDCCCRFNALYMENTNNTAVQMLICICNLRTSCHFKVYMSPYVCGAKKDGTLTQELLFSGFPLYSRAEIIMKCTQSS